MTLAVSQLVLSFLILLGSDNCNMVQGLVLKELLNRPYIRTALGSAAASSSKIKTPQCVLSFFYGVDYADPEDIHDKLTLGKALPEMSAFWFAGGPDYDVSCQAFQEMTRQAGQYKLLSTSNPEVPSDWFATVDGLTAQLILCDQLSRNAFRGTPEAFAYDDAALKFAHMLTQHILSNGKDQTDEPSDKEDLLVGTVYPPYVSNVITALMHSESSKDHRHALELIERQQDEVAQEDENSLLRRWWKNQLDFEIEHKKVIDRFGRYPHRNRLKGRTTTAAEQTWLDDKENLPGWAKSQG
mmetsp:Transcript_21806/g.60623  ORF Transcript_21806/g.60623 Transcript_21806/m.60623 type:complete len:298 (-) Transcript_21806:3235-4128(-)